MTRNESENQNENRSRKANELNEKYHNSQVLRWNSINQGLLLEQFKEHIESSLDLIYSDIDANLIKSKMVEIHHVVGELYVLSRLIERPGSKYSDYKMIIDELTNRSILLIEDLYTELDRVRAFEMFDLMQKKDLYPVIGISIPQLPNSEKEFFKRLGIEIENSELMLKLIDRYAGNEKLKLGLLIKKYIQETKERISENDDSNKKERVMGIIKVGAGLTGIGGNILGGFMAGVQVTLSSVFLGGWVVAEGLAKLNFFTKGTYHLLDDDHIFDDY